MKVLGLFDGIGCWYHGIRAAGFDVEQYYAVETELGKNSKGVIVPSKMQWPRRIADATIPNISRPCDLVEDFTAATAAKIGHIDLLVASPPCQPFSQAGHKKGMADARGVYFLKVAEIIELVRPAHFIIENVPPSKNSGALEAFARAFGVPGVKFNSDKYGAQHRERMFWSSAAIHARKEPNAMTVADIMLPDSHPSALAMKRYIWTPVEPYGDAVKVIGTIGKIGKRSTIGYKVPSSNGVYSSAGKMPALLGKSHGADACQGVILDLRGGSSQSQRVYDAKGKSTAQTCGHGGGGARTGLYADRPMFGDRQGSHIYGKHGKATTVISQNSKQTVYADMGQTARPLAIEECAALQNLPPELIAAARTALPKLPPSPLYKAIGNGVDVLVTADIVGQVINGSRGQGRL